MAQDNKHPGVICDSCRKPIGSLVRYKCLVCPNYNLCGDCEELEEQTRPTTHEMQFEGHNFVKMRDSRIVIGMVDSKPNFPQVQMLSMTNTRKN